MLTAEKLRRSLLSRGQKLGRVSNRVGSALLAILLWQIPHYDRWGIYTQISVASVCCLIWRVFDFALAPGDAVAALAVVAVVITIRADSLTPPEKVGWVIISFALFTCETNIIHRDRERAFQEQKVELGRQADQFRETLSSFRDLHNQNSAELKQTNSLLTATDKSLLNITGGDDFGYVLPSENHLHADGFSIRLYNDGEEQLTGVTVRVEKVLRDCAWPPKKDTACTVVLDGGVMHPFQMGTLGPSTSVLVPQMVEPSADADGMSHYRIEIAAQNGIVLEQLWFRHAANGQGWAYKYLVYRKVIGKSKKGDFSGEGFNFRPLKQADWKEPPTHP
jgi:hypothetical protein